MPAVLAVKTAERRGMRASKAELPLPSGAGPDLGAAAGMPAFLTEPSAPTLDYWAAGHVAAAAGLGETDLAGRASLQLKPPAIMQPKLAINSPGDIYEQEADRISEQVMRMPVPGVSATPTVSSVARVQRACFDCQVDSDDDHLQMKPAGPNCRGEASAPPIVHEVLSSPGQPLDAATRALMEPRFGRDFGDLRVHTGTKAAESARAVNASAYTAGSSIVFGSGQYAPHTDSGRHLLAHELTHVVQQSGGSGGQGRAGVPPVTRSPTAVQRTCQQALGAPAPDCTPSQDSVVGWQFLFKVGCDELRSGEGAKISKLRYGRKLKIHGFASQEGDATFNDDLSCHRANVIAELAAKKRPECPVVGRYKHGASPPAPQPAEPRSFWRSVIVEELRPAPEEWLDPASILAKGSTLYKNAKDSPSPQNLDAAAAYRADLKTWLEDTPKSAFPAGRELDRQDLDDYRQFNTTAESLWKAIDKLLADHSHTAAKADTFDQWAGANASTPPGPDDVHAKHVPTGARYHIDIFGEGMYPGAVNIGMATRSSTTGVPGSRVPNAIYRKFGSNAAANRLPIADHAADLVTSENGPLMQAGLIKEIARIVAPGGTIVLYGPDNMEEWHDRVAKAVGGTIKKEFDPGGLESIITVPKKP